MLGLIRAFLHVDAGFGMQLLFKISCAHDNELSLLHFRLLLQFREILDLILSLFHNSL